VQSLRSTKRVERVDAGTLRALRELGVAIRPGDGQVFRRTPVRGLRDPRSKLTFRLQVVLECVEPSPSKMWSERESAELLCLEYARHGFVQ